MSFNQNKDNSVKKAQIEQFLVKFYEYYRYKGHTDSTIEKYYYGLRQFPEFIDGKEINKDTVRDYILYCKNQDSKSTNGLGKPD